MNKMKIRGLKKLRKRALPIFEGGFAFSTTSPLATYRLGELLGRVFHSGIVALFGELGSGKTVFAKGLAHSLGVRNVHREVVSPSFMLIREHEGRMPFYYMDLYRVGSEDELIQLNLPDYFSREGVVLIEWAERAGHYLPEESIQIHFAVLDRRKRRIEITKAPQALLASLSLKPQSRY